MLIAPLIHEAFRSIKKKLRKSAEIKPPYQGPSMQQYYRDIDLAVQAGYEAGRMNKSIHEARAYIATHVGE